jgi:hypothetical protein
MINQEAPVTAKPSIAPRLAETPPPSFKKSEEQNIPAIPKPKVDIQRRAMDFPPKSEEKNPAPAPAAAPNPQETTANQEKAPQSRTVVEPELQSTRNGYILDRERRSDVREEKGTTSFKAGKKEKSLEGEQDSAGAVLQQAGNMEITLVVDELAAASGKIEDAVTALGGRINGHSYSRDTNLLFIRIRADRGKDLIDRLGRIGTVKRYPQLSSEVGGMIDMIIRW